MAQRRPRVTLTLSAVRQWFLDQDVSLSDALDTVDHVYTITSLAGFEALLRGIKVTTFGCPFYSGWGLTDDRQPNERRGRKLTIDQVFAAYILYPKYFDLIAKEPVAAEQALAILAGMRALLPKRTEKEAAVPDTVGLLAKAIADEMRRTPNRR